MSLAAATIALATVAFLLLPTGQVTTSSLVQINGGLCSVPTTAPAASLTEVTALSARPGSNLDLTGDVYGLGQGAPATRNIDGTPLTPRSNIRDGSSIEIRHGKNHLETLRQKTQTIPQKTVYKGSGSILTLVQSGADGKQELFLGSSSGKQAAVFLLASPKETIYQRSPAPKPKQKLAALTFDDGPGPYTQAVLDALAKKNVKATFFVLGGNAAANQAMIKKIKAAGHAVENHSWSHPVLTRVSADKVRSELARTSEVIGGARYFRPPYGAYNAAVKAEAAAQGLRTVLWTVDTRDWETPKVDAIMRHVKAETGPGAIILMHDGGGNRSQTVAAIPVIVDWLLSQGYSLTTLDHIL